MAPKKSTFLSGSRSIYFDHNKLKFIETQSFRPDKFVSLEEKKSDKSMFAKKHKSQNRNLP